MRYVFDAAVPRDISVPETELCAVLSNMLDNAIAAQATVPETERFVGLKAQVRAGFLVVECTNVIANSMQGSAVDGNSDAACDAASANRAATGGATKDAPAVKSAPRSITQDHGWGQDILATIAARHGGVFETRQEANTYVCMVALGL